MPLADRLGSFEPSNNGCVSCKWYEQLDDTDRSDFDDWLRLDGNIAKLHRACQAPDEDESKAPLLVDYSAFLYHVRQHWKG